MTEVGFHKTPGSAALEKALILFTRIVQDRGNTNITMLAADMQLPRSTLYRLTATLEARGMISRIARGKYDVGMRLAAQMDNVSAQVQLATICRPLLRRLARDCDATAHLGVMENDMVTYLVKETGRGKLTDISFTRENAQLEAYCSGIGKVLLAGLPADGLAKYLDGGPFVGLTKHTITDPQELSEHIKRIRNEKFACDAEEVAENLRCLAVPIWNDSQPVMAAISLSFYNRDEFLKDEVFYLMKLRTCATKIGRLIGNHAPADI